MTTRSKQGCERRINRLIREYQRNFSGGGSFGWGWPTFHMNDPEWFDEVRSLQKLHAELPFRDGTRLAR